LSSSLSWTNLQFLVQASTNSSTLKFGFLNDLDYSVLDSISVLPVPLPVLQGSVSPASPALRLAWTSLPGVHYQVQYKTQPGQTTWTNLGSRLTASSSTTTASDSLGPDPERFYRVVIAP